MLLVYLALLATAFVMPVTCATINATVTGFRPDEVRLVQHAMDYWSGVIQDPFTAHVSISMLDVEGDLLGASFAFTEDAQGRPSGGTIEIDNRAGSVIGWFVDPTPATSDEFTPGATPYHAYAHRPGPAADSYDLLTTLHHEFAHLFGFSTVYSRFEALVQPSDDYPPLRTFTGGTVTALITATYEGTHLSDALYPFDLMTPYQTRGQRMLPSDLDLAILGDAFGYTLDGAGPEPIPEPATTILIGAGLVVIWEVQRRFGASGSRFRIGC